MNFAELFIVIVILDILTIVFIIKDDRYFFDSEKSGLILIVLFLPILGAFYILSKLRDDIRLYIALGVLVFVGTCVFSSNRWSFSICIKLLGQMGKLLS